jgi:hypothetical protein
MRKAMPQCEAAHKGRPDRLLKFPPRSRVQVDNVGPRPALAIIITGTASSALAATKQNHHNVYVARSMDGNRRPRQGTRTRASGDATVGRRGGVN